jgi:hypothetical protein
MLKPQSQVAARTKAKESKKERTESKRIYLKLSDIRFQLRRVVPSHRCLGSIIIPVCFGFALWEFDDVL